MSDLTDYVLSHQPTGIRQSVPEGTAFNGKVPNVGVELNPDEDVIAFDEAPGDGSSDDDMGLITFEQVEPDDTKYRSNYSSPWLFNFFMRFDSGVGWAISITSGKRDGSGGDVDDPTGDVELASGSGQQILTPKFGLLPRQCVRITSDSAGANGGEVLLITSETATNYGRID